MGLFCDLSDLCNESDVEQKLIYPFLVSTYPVGCAYEPKEVKTKSNIVPYTIGKANRKVYIPDYTVTISGIPMIVIEAKSPNVELDEAFSEARLYAHELNSGWKHNENPCKKIIVCNGKQIWAGFYDQKEPIITVPFESIAIGDVKYNSLLEFAKKETLLLYRDELIRQQKGKSKYFKPVRNIGYKNAVDEEIKGNALGMALAFEYSNILIPDSEEDYKLIVENAYVHSQKKENHVEPILRIIRSARLPSVDEATRVTSDNIDPLVNGVRGLLEKKRKNSLILLIGSVGSGKSTFIRYLQNVSVPKKTDLANQLYWCILNMNNAPLSTEKIYGWLEDSIIKIISSAFPECCFSERQFLDTLYKDQINDFCKGVGSYLKDDQAEYTKQLYLEIKKCIEDKTLTLRSLIQYITKVHRKTCLFVFDNVDKSSPENQLLMFQVAEWFRNTYSSLVMLSLRDSTYNEYRTRPPLDTVVKDLVFRIDPPDLLAVLNERLKYIYRLTKKDINQDGYYVENDMKIRLRENDHLVYFKCMLHSIRQNNIVKTAFYSITGKDVRAGIELFIEFCKSGHLLATDFFAVRATDGKYEVPHHRMLHAILRGTRLYYSDKNSKIKNLFSSDYSDEWVDPFIRVDILLWLYSRKDEVGDIGTRGFFKVGKLHDDMISLGHGEKQFCREVSVLIEDRLIISSNLDNYLDPNNYIRISQFGSFHVYLLSEILYLSACSEDVYYKDNELCQRISDRITGKIGDGYLSKTTIIANARDMLNYLKDYRELYLAKPERILANQKIEIFDLKPCFEALERMMLKWSSELSLAEKKEKFPKNKVIECMVISIKSYGIFVSMELVEEGFISESNLGNYSYKDFDIADVILAKVLGYRESHGRFELEFIEKL